MASDIRLEQDNVIVEGNLGIGIANPRRPIHVEGSEIHSGGAGAGFSFSDRQAGALVDSPNQGQRWVWYSHGGKARLWSGQDKLSLDANGNIDIKGYITAEGHIATNGIIATNSDIVANGTITANGPLKGETLNVGSRLSVDVNGNIETKGRIAADVLSVGSKIAGNFLNGSRLLIVNETVHLINPETISTGETMASALRHTSDDRLVINSGNGYKQGVGIEGDLALSGDLRIAGGQKLWVANKTRSTPPPTPAVEAAHPHLGVQPIAHARVQPAVPPMTVVNVDLIDLVFELQAQVARLEQMMKRISR